MKTNSIFTRLLVNTLFANIVGTVVWFALTYWVFLETRSILATSLVAGIFAVSNAITALFFGAIVDHHKKKHVMMLASALSCFFFALGLVLYLTIPETLLLDLSKPYLWVFIVVLLAGTIVGNLRMIALTTTVTMLFSAEERGKKNGLVGIVNGSSFALTSVLSGLLVGFFGMGSALVVGLSVSGLVLIHMLTIPLVEERVVVSGEKKGVRERIDIKGTWRLIAQTPGLFSLIFFTTFNNFLGGAFMALMDSYGLSLVSVKVWGVLWGFLSLAFITGGILTSKIGVGKRPLYRLFTLNAIMWVSCIFFTIQPSIVLLSLGAIVWMMSFPMIEASEQTILQKVVPFERQGRVIGFAQTIEQAATPLTAFLIGPLTQFVVVPFMTDGLGAQTIGHWFGTGQDRAIAVVFTISGIVGLIVTLIARHSRATKKLSLYYERASDLT